MRSTSPSRGKSVWAFIAGLTLSNIGDSVLLVAFMVWLTTSTGSPSWGATASFLVVLPTLAGPVWGWLADVGGVRRWLTASSVVGGVLLVTGALTFAALVDPHASNVLPLLGLALVYGVVSAAIDPGVTSAIPKMATSLDELTKLNGISQALNQGLRIVTPLVGASLFALLGGPVLVVATGVLFVLAGACYAKPRYDQGHFTKENLPDDLIRQDGRALTAGWHAIQRSSDLKAAVWATVAVMGVIGMAEAAIIGLLTGTFGLDAVWLGPVLTVQAVGLVGGLVTASKVLPKHGAARVQVTGLGLVLLGFVTLLPGYLPLAMTMPVVSGVGFGMYLIAYSVRLQSASPDEVRGVIAGTASALIAVTQTAAIGAGALLVAPIGPRGVILIIVITLAGTTLAIRRSTRVPSRDQIAGLLPEHSHGRPDVEGATK